MKLSLERYMEDIETRLNEEDELRLLAEWNQWVQHTNKAGSAFSPAKRSSVPSTLDWPHVNINDAIKDDDLAIYQELEVVNANLCRGNNCFHPHSCQHRRRQYGICAWGKAFYPAL